MGGRRSKTMLKILCVLLAAIAMADEIEVQDSQDGMVMLETTESSETLHAACKSGVQECKKIAKAVMKEADKWRAQAQKDLDEEREKLGHNCASDFQDEKTTIRESLTTAVGLLKKTTSTLNKRSVFKYNTKFMPSTPDNQKKLKKKQSKFMRSWKEAREKYSIAHFSYLEAKHQEEFLRAQDKALKRRKDSTIHNCLCAAKDSVETLKKELEELYPKYEKDKELGAHMHCIADRQVREGVLTERDCDEIKGYLPELNTKGLEVKFPAHSQYSKLNNRDKECAAAKKDFKKEDKLRKERSAKHEQAKKNRAKAA